MSEKNGTKTYYLDIAATKVVCIVMVITVHCIMFYASNPFALMRYEKTSVVAEAMERFIDISAVPGFLFCSGFLFAKGVYEKKRTWFGTLKERFLRLVVPYLAFGSLWLVPLYTIFNVPSYGRPEGAGWLEGYKYMLLGQFADHLWYLEILFEMTIFFMLLWPLCRKKMLPLLGGITLAAIIGGHFLLANVYNYKLIYLPDYVMCFFVGICCYHLRDEIGRMKLWLMFVILGILTAGIIVYMIFMPSFFVFQWIAIMFGGFVVFFVCRILDRFGLLERMCKGQVWEFLDKNSFIIYLFNLPIPKVLFIWFSPYFGDHIHLCMIMIVICTWTMLIGIVCVYNLIKGAVMKLIRGGRKSREV